MRLLVLVTGDRIGDALLKWPVITGLKMSAPNIHLTWIAARRASVFCGPLAELASGVIDNAVEKAGIGISWGELLRSPPPYHADVVISTEPKIRHAILDKRIPHSVFISPAAKFIFSDKKPSSMSAGAVSVQARLQQLFELAIGKPISLHHAVSLPAGLLEQAAEILPHGKTYVGFSPGAGGQSKRWPAERFIEVAKAQQREGRTPVFFLGPEEAHMLEEIKNVVPTAIFPEYDAGGSRIGGVLLSIALAARMRCSVANDSGGGHILAAGGQPLVSLYGHTSAHKFRPQYGKHIALSASDFGSSEDMTAIPVHEVDKAIDDELRTC